MKLGRLPVAVAVLLAAPRHPLNQSSGEDPAILGEEVDQALASLPDPLFVSCAHLESSRGIHRVMADTV